MPASIPEKDRKKLEHAALHCPVKLSLAAGLQVPVTFLYA
jgi:hypothetical protein